MMRKNVIIGIAALFAMGAIAQTPPKSVDEVLRLYVDALGGKDAVQAVTSRDLEVKQHRTGKATLYWQAPDKVLRVVPREREGFDGASAWYETKKKKVKRLPKAAEDQLETDANPIRYVHLKEMYSELEPAPTEMLDGSPMDVLTAPNQIGATKFYFDAGTHLLIRIQEFGVNSAYYKHATDFADYKDAGGVKLPFRILRSSDEPGTEKGELRILKVRENPPLNAAMFTKPNIAAVMTGGKR
jgi:hypothetical protein